MSGLHRTRAALVVLGVAVTVAVGGVLGLALVVALVYSRGRQG